MFCRRQDYGEPIDVPVGLVSAHPNTKSNIILKLGDKRGFYLVDTRGNFYNRKKLESMITFRTSWVRSDAVLSVTTTPFLTAIAHESRRTSMTR